MTIELTSEETIKALTKEVTTLNLGRIGLMAYQDRLVAHIVALEAELAVLTVEPAEPEAVVG